MAQVSDNAAPTANGHDGVAAITDALEATNLELGRKIFVGNLNFTTKEEQLKELFVSHGSISDVQIILRGTRSLGYGFVTFEKVEDAEKAVAAIDKTEIDGRTVNVEIAKPAPGTPGGPAPRGAKKNGAAAAEGEENKDNTTRGSKPRRGRGGRGRGRGRGPRSRQTTTDGAKTEQDGAEATEQSGETPAAPAKRGGRSGRGRGGNRAARREGPPEGEPSKVLLFVANLPFSLTDEGLKEFFNAYEVTSAHVVRRKFGQSAGKSKGFGFVEFANEAVQQKALEESQGKEMNGRELHIKVAVNELKKEEEEKDGETGPAVAAAAAPQDEA